jgi:uroporphyrinogen-III synthase
VLVTRPDGQSAGLCRLIDAAGGRPVPFPAIRILPASEPERARRLLADPADLLVFISRNAVERALPLFPGGRLPEAPRLAAVGRATARALASAGRAPDLVPDGRYDTESLLELAQLQDLRGQRVVIVRGEGGRPALGDGLRQRGAEVSYAEVYRRAPTDADPGPLLERWGRDVQLVTATSGEILENLIHSFGARRGSPLFATPLIVVSERTARRARQAGFRRVLTARRADDRALVEALCLGASDVTPD